MTTDGAQLFARAAGGDAEALRTLLTRHGGQVWAEINADIGTRWQSAVDADDVMQVSYMEAFLRIDQMTARDAVSFVGWLRSIARNNLRDAIKELERKKRPPPARRLTAGGHGDSYTALADLLGATSSTPSQDVANRELAGLIESMLQRMPPDYGQVIRLYDLEGRSIADVATELNRSAGAVHMLRARAHDRLRTMLGAETDFFSHPA